MKSSLLTAAAVGLSLLLLAGCGRKSKRSSPPAPEVEVITAQPQNVPIAKNFVGRLSPYRSANVLARVSGILLRRAYVEGTDVEKGQLLFVIDPAPLKAALDASLAALAEARATYANDQFTAKQSRALAPKGYISKTALESALAAERTSAAAVQAAQANVEAARINLGYAYVKSPINGRAAQQQVTEGALVSASSATPLTTVNQIDPLYANFTMSVAQLEQLRGDQGKTTVSLVGLGKTSVKVTLPSGSAYAEQGALDFGGITVNPATGSVALRAKIPNPKHILLPGMYVTLTVDLGQERDVYLIPQTAVQRDNAGAYVMLVGKNGKVSRGDVTTGAMQGSDWIVTAGIKAGDQVIASDLQTVKAGEAVKATPWPPPASGRSAPTPAGSTRAAGQ
ncbi:MAG: efflux RND transporter periplasmic adaptor subunit [Rhodanobacteraceae bacterium]